MGCGTIRRVPARQRAQRQAPEPCLERARARRRGRIARADAVRRGLCASAAASCVRGAVRAHCVPCHALRRRRRSPGLRPDGCRARRRVCAGTHPAEHRRR
eukprot:Amastigsp_a2667_5.p9 type:complete len:101 gc:universal Amastigsp_a2667_5:797-1099(+)